MFTFSDDVATMPSKNVKSNSRVGVSKGVYKKSTKSAKEKALAKARARPVPLSTKAYVARKLDAKIPDRTFIKRYTYTSNSGITDADIVPTFGVFATHYGLNIAQCVVHSAGQDHGNSMTYDQAVPRGLRLKSLQVTGQLRLPTDWGLKGTGYSYLTAYIFVFILRPKVRQISSVVSYDDLFIQPDEVNSLGQSQHIKDQDLGGTPTYWAGTHSDSMMRFNNRKYKLLGMRKVFLTGGVTNLQISQVDGSDVPGTGSTHGFSMPQHMKKNFSINIKCPKYIRWDQNVVHNSGVENHNHTPDFNPHIAIGYIREGGTDSLDTMLSCDYFVKCRVEPPAMFSSGP